MESVTALEAKTRFGQLLERVAQGEEIIIMAFEYTDTPTKPKSILMDQNNIFVQYL